MIVVSDSTIFIGLAKIKKIDLLQSLFQKIYIPEAVFREVAGEGEERPGAKEVSKRSLGRRMGSKRSLGRRMGSKRSPGSL